MQLEGKVAVVNGGAVRLGRALALALAYQGVRLALHYGSSEGQAADTVSQIEAIGGEALALQADLSRLEETRTIIPRAMQHFGQVDILVNSAAIFEQGDLSHTTEENWDRHFAINLKSPFFLSQAFAAQVGRTRQGHIVNIVDWRAFRPGTHYMAYTMTKAALVTMTQSLALAAAPNIQVNAIAPGTILPPPGQGQAYLDQRAQTIPARRPGTPAEVAKALLYLLDSEFVTGEVIFVTGGEHL